jgi:hypothetical protein
LITSQKSRALRSHQSPPIVPPSSQSKAPFHRISRHGLPSIEILPSRSRSVKGKELLIRHPQSLFSSQSCHLALNNRHPTACLISAILISAINRDNTVLGSKLRNKRADIDSEHLDYRDPPTPGRVPAGTTRIPERNSGRGSVATRQ